MLKRNGKRISANTDITLLHSHCIFCLASLKCQIYLKVPQIPILHYFIVIVFSALLA